MSQRPSQNLETGPHPRPQRLPSRNKNWILKRFCKARLVLDGIFLPDAPLIDISKRNAVKKNEKNQATFALFNTFARLILSEPIQTPRCSNRGNRHDG